MQVSSDQINWFELQYEHLCPNWEFTRVVTTENGIDWISDVDARKRLYAMLNYPVKSQKEVSDMETATVKAHVCTAVHPTTKDTCAKPTLHFFSHDPQVKQHIASNGVKWPSLHELDPNEGYNDTVLHHM